MVIVVVAVVEVENGIVFMSRFWAPPAIFSATYLDNGLLHSTPQRISFPFFSLRNPLLSIAGLRRISNNLNSRRYRSSQRKSKSGFLSGRRGEVM